MYRAFSVSLFGTHLEVSIGLMRCIDMVECDDCFWHVARDACGRFRFAEVGLGPYIFTAFRMNDVEHMAHVAFLKAANWNDFVDPVLGFVVEKMRRATLFGGPWCDRRQRLRCIRFGLRDAVRRAVSAWWRGSA
jgi:hypothetical protein